LARRVGFSLAEIARALAAVEGGESGSGDELRRLATAKLPEIDSRIRELQSMRKLLVAASSCRCPSRSACTSEAKASAPARPARARRAAGSSDSTIVSRPPRG